MTMEQFWMMIELMNNLWKPCHYWMEKQHIEKMINKIPKKKIEWETGWIKNLYWTHLYMLYYLKKIVINIWSHLNVDDDCLFEQRFDTVFWSCDLFTCIQQVDDVYIGNYVAGNYSVPLQYDDYEDKQQTFTWHSQKDKHKNMIEWMLLPSHHHSNDWRETNMVLSLCRTSIHFFSG